MQQTTQSDICHAVIELGSNAADGITPKHRKFPEHNGALEFPANFSLLRNEKKNILNCGGFFMKLVHCFVTGGAEKFC